MVPKAKRVIFLFMQGGPSQVDSFDYKPVLEKEDGKQFAFDDARIIANTGMRGTSQRSMKSPWKFRQYGDSGRWVSELFPEIGRHADDLCFIHSMHTEGVAHGPATLFLHCGATNPVRPSVGSWVTYGLGTENENLPGFVSLSPSSGNGGPRNYGNAFLPPVYQGTAIGRAGLPATQATIRNLTAPSSSDAARSAGNSNWLQSFNAEQLAPAYGRPGTRRGAQFVRTRLEDAAARPGRLESVAGDAGDAGRCTASAKRRPMTSAGSA